MRRFRLLNMRQSARFVLLRNGFEYPTAAASSEEVEVENPNEPTGGHLALTGKQGCATRFLTHLDPSAIVFAADALLLWGPNQISDP